MNTTGVNSDDSAFCRKWTENNKNTFFENKQFENKNIAYWMDDNDSCDGI